jgi:DNA-binding NtrC family response regulator
MLRSVLIVDDDTRIRASLSQALADSRTEVSSAENAEAALAVLAEQPASVALVDLKMPGMGGMELLRLLRERSPDVDVIIMTAYDDLPTVATAMSEGAVDFLVKPLDLHHLRRVLDRLFEDREVRLCAAVGGTEQAEKTDGLIGRDPQMVEIFKVVGRVATNRTNVVIRGESGTGKELIAREIHAISPYSDEPFVAVNCTALPATLLESELFGHVRGAFTGASSDRRGRFSLAGRGTIFLDEIGDTTLEFQAKLLRVLQEHEYYPVGAEKAERTEARVIAATHRDLEAMLGAGRFREDLYYRLRVVEITIPPLRDRMEDVTRLAEHLVAKAATAVGKDAPIIAPPAMEALMSYSWPGNVRELENCLIRAVVVATGDVIHPEHLRLEGRSPQPAGLTTLEEVEKEHVVRVLTATRGHKSRSAEILGVSRPRLDRLIHKLELVELLERLRRGEEPRSQTDRD